MSLAYKDLRISVVADRATPRLAYVMRLVFIDLLGFDDYWLTQQDVYMPQFTSEYIIHYAHEPLPGVEGLHILPHGLLHETGTLPVEDMQALELDPFAAIFWLVTHYAAYDSNHPRDEHGRPLPARLPSYPDPTDPVCHRLALNLAEQVLRQGGMGLDRRDLPQLQMRHTVDIDNAYAYSAKGPWRWIGSLAKDLLAGRWANVSNRLAHAFGRVDDPYDTHALILDKLGGVLLTTFFLVSDKGKFDRAISPKRLEFARLLRQYRDARAEIALHPSYAGGQSASSLKLELKLLESLCDTSVQAVRYHYLRLLTPKTQRLLIQQGIRHDYSAGPVVPGFWQGISTSFFWFDVENNRETHLRMHPAAWMDVHWIQDPSKGLAHLQELKVRLAPFGGKLICIWHNDYFASFAAAPSFEEVGLR